jgi:hypothetical protein
MMTKQFRVAVATFLFIILVTPFSFSQTTEKHLHSREQLWVGYFNQTRFTNRWGLWADGHYRMTGDFVERPFQFLLRAAVTYYIKDNLRIHVGYVFAQHFPGKGLTTTRTEHRPWQQLWWNQKYPGFSTRQWIRLEQRFNEKIVDDVKQEGYNYNFRARYSFSISIPLKGKDIVAKTPFVNITDEVMLNFGSKIVYNTFDQNRISAALGYQITEQLNVQLGYMNIYQQEVSGSSYLLTHAVRLYFFHALDLRNSE